MRLSQVEFGDDVALLAPGFGDGRRWSVLRPCDASGSVSALWYAAYETAGGAAVRLPVRVDAIEPVWDLPADPVAYDLDDAGFAERVEAIRGLIAAGDVYQVNLTLRAAVACGSGARLLSTLCRRATPRFAAWVKMAAIGELVSASPEMLVEVRGGRIRTEPMKGTAAAGERAWLEASIKDRAELAMITDLLRDDLHRLCRPGSVSVPSSRRLVELPYAIQAVSEVQGVLRDGIDIRAVLAQLHPGGSVTGAPRVAACAVIAALEPTPRGAYCGVLGLEHEGQFRAALLIRTAERRDRDSFVYGVGGGITWDSTAPAELAEIGAKLGVLR